MQDNLTSGSKGNQAIIRQPQYCIIEGTVEKGCEKCLGKFEQCQNSAKFRMLVCLGVFNNDSPCHFFFARFFFVFQLQLMQKMSAFLAAFLLQKQNKTFQ